MQVFIKACPRGLEHISPFPKNAWTYQVELNIIYSGLRSLLLRLVHQYYLHGLFYKEISNTSNVKLCHNCFIAIKNLPKNLSHYICAYLYICWYYLHTLIFVQNSSCTSMSRTCQVFVSWYNLSLVLLLIEFWIKL